MLIRFFSEIAFVSFMIFLCANSTLPYLALYPPKMNYIYLYLATISAIPVIYSTFSFSYISKISYKTLLLICFLLYVVINSSLYLSTTDLKQVLIGSTGGIFFFFIFGFALNRCLIMLTYNYHCCSKKTFMINFIILFGVVSLVLLLHPALSNVRGSIFYLKGSNPSYQRPADYISVLYIILIFLIFRKIDLLPNIVKKYYYFFLATILSLATLLLLLLYGSNKGSLLVSAVYVFFLILFFNLEVLSKNNTRFLKKIFKVMISKTTVLLIAVLLSIVLIYINKYGLPHIRIFSWGTESLLESSSLTSRISLDSNFFQQFFNSPVFGQFNVEDITTGVGTYPHSLILSLLTKLGIVGFAIFSIFLFFYIKHLNYLCVHNSHSSGVSLNYFSFGVFLMILLPLV